MSITFVDFRHGDNPASPKRLVAQAQSAPVPVGLVSIVIPCCGQLEYTRLCIPNLLRHSRPPYELLFLDVASVDGTAEYLAGLATAATIRVDVLRTVSDLDIAEACKEIVARAHGEYLVLLNNDMLVTDGWLEQMVAMANLSPAIGLVGPMTNHATPPQLVEGIPYRIGTRAANRTTPDRIAPDSQIDVAPLDSFAREWRETHKGKWIDAERLGGFCLLIKRHVLTQIGQLNTGPGVGLFDTDALCYRARHAGFKSAVCRDLFIHNFGSRDFSFCGDLRK